MSKIAIKKSKLAWNVKIGRKGKESRTLLGGILIRCKLTIVKSKNILLTKNSMLLIKKNYYRYSNLKMYDYVL